jgi:nicotinate-nucleotide adenylyltransferase
MTATPYIALLGGSFNPPHVGHLRIALEVWEAFRPERLLFIPCASPPHKTPRSMLPFELRVRMLRSTLRRHPGMRVSSIEKTRPGPSYTVETLTRLRAVFPDKKLLFILGAENLAQLSTWNRWERLPELADMVVLPRDACAAASFAKTAGELWPRCARIPSANAGACSGTSCEAFRLPQGGHLFYLPQPCLDISSSLIRDRWMAGRSLDFLVPDGVSRHLDKSRDIVDAVWRDVRDDFASGRHGVGTGCNSPEPHESSATALP